MTPLWHFWRFYETRKRSWDISFHLDRRTFGLGIKIHLDKDCVTLQFQVLNFSFYGEAIKKSRHKWNQQ